MPKQYLETMPLTLAVMLPGLSAQHCCRNDKYFWPNTGQIYKTAQHCSHSASLLRLMHSLGNSNIGQVLGFLSRELPGHMFSYTVLSVPLEMASSPVPGSPCFQDLEVYHFSLIWK